MKKFCRVLCLLALLLFFPMVLWGETASASQETYGIRLRNLLNDFSNPAMKASSEQILQKIFDELDCLTAQKNFFGAERYVEQLEVARIGRTFSLYRSPQKQRQDLQLLKIWSFSARFYRKWAEDTKQRDNLEEASRMFLEADKITKKAERLLSSVGEWKTADLKIFEDPFHSREERDSSNFPRFVTIPTRFFAFLPGMAFGQFPFAEPFSLLFSSGIEYKIALSETWYWSFGTWKDCPNTCITGISPSGQIIFWVTSPLSQNRNVDIQFHQNRWILSPGGPSGAAEKPGKRNLFD